MHLLPLPDELATLVASVLLIMLTLSVLIVWRRRIAEGRAPDEALGAWPTGSSWPGHPGSAGPFRHEPASRWERAGSPAQRAAAELDHMRADGRRPETHDAAAATLATIPAQRTAPGGATAASVAAAFPADMRDRLVAILLVDHEAAVRALDELAACQKRLSQLADASEREQAVLDGALSRLAANGLRPEQLARLADLPLAEVEYRIASATA
jgi:hypothetical protein